MSFPKSGFFQKLLKVYLTFSNNYPLCESRGREAEEDINVLVRRTFMKFTDAIHKIIGLSVAGTPRLVALSGLPLFLLTKTPPLCVPHYHS